MTIVFATCLLLLHVYYCLFMSLLKHRKFPKFAEPLLPHPLSIKLSIFSLPIFVTLLFILPILQYGLKLQFHSIMYKKMQSLYLTLILTLTTETEEQMQSFKGPPPENAENLHHCNEREVLEIKNF